MRRVCLIAGLVLASSCAALKARAESYPSHPITMVVPFAAGAPVDTVGRVIAERMRLSLGQPIILENVSGAAGSLGATRAVRAAPDGYTISLGNISSHVLNGAIYQLPFDVLKDFEPVALLASNPQLILSKNALPANDLKSLIALAEGQSRQGIGGNRRHGRRGACRRRVLSKGDRNAFPVCALSRHEPGAAGFDRRADRSAVRPGGQRTGEREGWQNQGLCGHGKDAPRLGSRDSDGR